MLFILTSSLDGTSDILVELSLRRGLDVFRFNLDLFERYRFTWDSTGFRIQDPTGRSLDSKNISAVYYRKPTFSGESTSAVQSGDAKDWVKAQMVSAVRELALWARRRQLLRLVDPEAERRISKLTQLELAPQFFETPEWQLGWNCDWHQGERIVKALEARLLPGGKFLYSRKVDTSLLGDDSPWLVQSQAPGDRDVTLLFVAGRQWGFELVRGRTGSHDDWRVLIGKPECHWRAIPIPQQVELGTRAFMQRIGLHYGRLDFIADGNTWTFLEVNSNGQFGWLDGEDGAIHSAVLDAVLDSTTTIS